MSTEDPKNPERESVAETMDFSKNVLVVGIPHYLTPEYMQKLEEYVKNADFVCIEWDQIRDNQAKGLPGGYKEHIHFRPFMGTKLKGDHLYRGVVDTFLQENYDAERRERIAQEAFKRGGSAEFKTSKGNEFLYIQELCEKYGKKCYFVDKLVTHTKARVLNLSRDMGIFKADEAEARNRSRYMQEKVLDICRERFVETGKEEQAALFVGGSHLDDFRGGFKKAEPVETPAPKEAVRLEDPQEGFSSFD